ncbi:MAG: hypothetical protein WCD44_04150 [Candidatus Babeliales bacterium]
MNIKNVFLLLFIFAPLFVVGSQQDEQIAKKLQLTHQVRLASKVKNGIVRFVHLENLDQAHSHYQKISDEQARSGEKSRNSSSRFQIANIRKLLSNIVQSSAEEPNDEKPDADDKLLEKDLSNPELICSIDGDFYHVDVEEKCAKLIPSMWGPLARFFPAKWPSNFNNCDCSGGCQNKNHWDRVAYYPRQEAGEQERNELQEEVASEIQENTKIIHSTILTDGNTKIVVGLTNTGHLLVLDNKNENNGSKEIRYDYSKKEKRDRFITCCILGVTFYVPFYLLVKFTLRPLIKIAGTLCLLTMIGKLFATIS